MEENVNQRIRAVLDDKQMSIAAFAKRIGMQQVTCNRQIRGDQATSLVLVEKILQEFENISAEWLLRGKGAMYDSDKSDNVAPVTEPQQDESVWKAKYEAIKECYDTLVSSLSGVMGKRNVG